VAPKKSLNQTTKESKPPTIIKTIKEVKETKDNPAEKKPGIGPKSKTKTNLE